MPPRSSAMLSPRERQVLDALYRLEEASVAELVDAIPHDLSYSAVRAALRTLRDKGEVAYQESGPRYVYSPVVPRDQARSRALEHVIRTFFDGSSEAAAVALMEMSDLELSDGQLREIEEMVTRAREEGR